MRLRCHLSTVFLLSAALCQAGPVFQSATRAGNIGFPTGVIPFATIDYITGPDASGDWLVVGEAMPVDSLDPSLSWSQGFLNLVPLPNLPDQLFKDQHIELAPGLYFDSVYVPPAQERFGDFPSFAGLLTDPLTGQAFPGGIIPPNQMGSPAALRICDSCAVTGAPEPGTFNAVMAGIAALTLLAAGRRMPRGGHAVLPVLQARAAVHLPPSPAA